MENVWNAALWPQFGAALDMLENAIAACPATLWTERVWPHPPEAASPPDPDDDPLPERFSEFWYVAYHALLWTDAYLTGDLHSFTPPAPLSLAEMDSSSPQPAQPYTPAEAREYLAYVRQKGRAALDELSSERAGQSFEFPWEPGKPISYLELQLYNLRHVQEHAAQLALFLGQRAVPEVPDWVMWTQEDPNRE